MTKLERYREFLRRKAVVTPDRGFAVSLEEINPLLKPHQKVLVQWAVAGGCRAIFAKFGLGKSMMQLETLRLILQRVGGRGLITAPLGVRVEFMRDAAKLGIEIKFVRRIEEAGETGIYLTNFETVRDGKLDPSLFTVCSLDEASVLRGFGGSKTFREFMRVYENVAYKFVATAIPDPNDHIELLAYAAFLGVMDVGQAKTRFFKRDATKADVLTIHPHKVQEFWIWVSTWAVFLQKPSDICGCICHSEKNYTAKHSDCLPSADGKQEHCGTALGSADAPAEILSSSGPLISLKASFSVVDACVQSMEVKVLGSTQSGKECSTGAEDPIIRTGNATEGGESQCVNAGSPIPNSAPTWDIPQKEKLSSVGTTTETMNPATATGQEESLKLEIPAAQLSSSTKVGVSLSQHGLKNSTSTTGSSTAGTKWDGLTKESSKTCCDRCRCDEGYDLPPMEVRYHEVAVDHRNSPVESNGQGAMFRGSVKGVVEASREKRDTLDIRVAKMLEIMAASPDNNFLLWHDLEAERYAVEVAVPGVVSVYGTQDLEEREQAIIDFSDGKIQYLAAKPVIAGSGCNFQRFCHREIFVGIGFKFNDFIQAIHRTYRFLQTQTVIIDIIYAESEREILRDLQRKWAQYEETVEKMSEIIREYGLDHAARMQELIRSMGVERVEVSGESYRCINNDCVEEAMSLPADSVDMVLTSIPFSTQYEYTPSYNDFGHTDDNEHFFEQMDFLTPELLRILQPGRIAAIHVKDRIVPGGMTGLGFQTVYPFHAVCIDHFKKHGFAYMGMKTIVTDVVRENNQTYRLGWTEQCKDGTKMGVGMPEYLLLFRKPPTENVNSYADNPVVKSKAKYSRARWQVDAHGFSRSSGNRLMTPEELEHLDHQAIFKIFRDYNLENIYDFEHHVRIGEALEAKRILPVTFMLLQPPSWHPEVWSDVTRMLTLNGSQHARGKELHICPMQFDIADRAIEQFTMEGETVFDPFGGLMTTAYRALKLGRKAICTELNHRYFLDGCGYVKAMEDQMAMPSLFDTLEEVVHA